MGEEIATIMNEFRMFLAERLLKILLKIIPADHPDGKMLLDHIGAYASEVLEKIKR